MPRSDWFQHDADTVNKRYIEYLGANQIFSDQRDVKTVRRFADIVLDIYEAKKIDLEDDGVDNPNLKVANYFDEILDSSFGDVSADIREHLPEVDEDSGGLSKYNQGVAKTGGTLFAYLLLYNLAENLLGTDVAVAYHMPDEMRDATTLKRTYAGEELSIRIEGDIVVFKPDDPSAPSIFWSMKSSLKERSHIITMWSLLVDIGQDDSQLEKYDIETEDEHNILDNMIYAAATADLAGDFDTPPRNLIKMDLSFLDYAFIARPDIEASSTISDDGEELYYHMDAVYDLITKVYDSVDYDDFGQAEFELTEDGIRDDHELGDFS